MTDHQTSHSRRTELATEDIPSIDQLCEETLRTHPSHRPPPNELHLRGGSIYPRLAYDDLAPPSNTPAARALSSPPPRPEDDSTVRSGLSRRALRLGTAGFALGLLVTGGAMAIPALFETAEINAESTPAMAPAMGAVTPPAPPVPAIGRAAPSQTEPQRVCLQPSAGSPMTCDPRRGGESILYLQVNVPRVSATEPEVSSTRGNLAEEWTSVAEARSQQSELTGSHGGALDSALTAEDVVPVRGDIAADVPPTQRSHRPFDVDAAASAVASRAVAAQSLCARFGESGRAAVRVTFAPSGQATAAVIAGGTLQGTQSGGCIAQLLQAATVPPHDEGYVTVRRVVHLRTSSSE